MTQPAQPTISIPSGTPLTSATIKNSINRTAFAHKCYIYNALNVLAVIGAVSTTNGTKTFRALFNLNTKNVLQAEILDNGSWITNVFDAIYHAETLLDAEFAQNFYSQNPGVSLPTYLATTQHPIKTLCTTTSIQILYPDIYNFLHTHSLLTSFGF